MLHRLSIVALLPAVFLAVTAASAADLAEAVPPDVYVFVDVPDLHAARAAGAGTAYGAILAEPAVAAFLQSGCPALVELRKDFRSVAGRSLRQMLDFCKGQAALVVMPSEEETAAVVVIMNVGRDKADFEAYLSDASGKSGLLWQPNDIPGATVKTAAAGSINVSYTIAGDWYLISNSASGLEKTVSGLLSGRKDNLAANPAFSKCRSLSTMRNHQVTAYINPARIIDDLGGFLPLVFDDLAHASGVTTLGGVFFSTRSEGKGFIDETVWYFPTGREGIFASVKPASADTAGYTAMLPAGSLSASWYSMDLKALATACSAAYNVIPAEMRLQADEFLARFKADSGVDLSADVFDSLGDNLVSYTALPSSLLDLGLSGGFGQHVTLVELSDQQRLQKAMDALWEHGRGSQPGSTTSHLAPGASTAKPAPAGTMKFSRQQFGKYTVYEVAIPLPRDLQIVPAFAIKDGWLLIATDALSIKSALGAPLVFKANILRNSDYMAAAQLVGSTNAGLSYTNNRAFFESFYPTVAFGLPFIFAQLGGAMPADQILLPPVTAIAPHLFGSAGAVTAAPDSIRVTSYGPIGTLRTAYIGTVAGAAIAKYLKGIQLPGQPAVPRKARSSPDDDLRALSATLGQFAAENQGLYPEDTDQLRKALLRAENSPSVLQRFTYVPGLTWKDDSRLVIAFDRNIGPAGRRVLLVSADIMHLTEEEVKQQIGGLLLLPSAPSAMDLDAACVENARVLAASVKRYANTHDGKVPDELTWKTFYLFAPLVTSCPADPKPVEPSYATVSGLDITKVPDKSKAAAVLVYETGSRHDAENAVAFLDGTTKRLPRRELESAIQKTRAFAR